MKSIQPYIATGLSALLALAAFAGCGSASSREVETVTKKQFIQRADAICETAEKELSEQGVGYLQAHPGAEEEDLVSPVVVPTLEKELRKLDSLETPSEDEQALHTILQRFKAAARALGEDPGVLFVARSNPFNKPNKMAEHYGFERCTDLP